MAEFTMSAQDPKCTETNINEGNILLIEDENLPPWVGLMDDPIQFNYREVPVRALSAEVLLKWRVVGYGVFNGTAGEGFIEILKFCNRWPGALPIHPGDIWIGGRIYPGFTPGVAWDKISQYTTKHVLDWSITHQIVGGRIEFFFNLYNGMRGIDTLRTLTDKNTKLTLPQLTRTGPIWNDVFAYGEGDGGGIYWSNARDEASIYKHGLRQYPFVANGTAEEGLRLAATKVMQVVKYPRNTVAPVLVDENGLYKTVGLGNRYTWNRKSGWFMNGRGFEGLTIRTIGWEHNVADGTVGLVLEKQDAKTLERANVA